jgi:hypothetical protein
MVLRAGSPYMQVGHLKELARLTGVIARSAYQGQWWLCLYFCGSMMDPPASL